MTPIEKNVIVVDGLGNEYEATYPKRAKGLVKNGRARFIEENKICLACPPHTELEDKIMSENKNVTQEKQTTAVPENVAEKTSKTLTIEYVLNKIEEITKDTAYIHTALEQLASMPKSDPGDIAGQEKAKAIGDIVRCRETTNQRLVAFYERLYDDLKPQDAKLKALDVLGEFAKNTNFDASSAAQLADTFGYIRHFK